MVTGSGTARTIVAVSESEDADLVILAKSGRGDSHRRAALGSVANRVIQTTQRPVLLVDAVGRRIHSQTAVSTCYSDVLSCENLIGIDIDRRWRSRCGNGSSMSSCLNKLKMEK